MAAKDMIQEATDELGKAIKAIQAGHPVQGSALAALTWLEAACLEKPTRNETEQILHLKCLVQCTNSEYDAAREGFEKANSGREIPPEWRSLGSTIYAMSSLPSDLNVALDQCNQAIGWLVENDQNSDGSPIKALLYGRKAFCHLRLNRVADAVACCNIASGVLPGHLAPLRIMSEIMMRQGGHESAIEYLSRAIANRPQGPHFWDYANRGNAFLETGNSMEALADLAIALQLDRNNPLILSNLGLAMNQMGNVTEAWRFYNQALMQDYGWVPAHNNRGTLFFESGEYGKAEREFTRAIELEADNATLYFNRGPARYEQEMYGECLSDISNAARLSNQSWETRYLAAMCKGRLKEYSTAVELLKTLVLDPGLGGEISSVIWNNLGVINHRADQLETAHSCFFEAVSKNPLNRQAKANLRKVESTMSGADLEATEEGELELTPRRTTKYLLGLSPSDALTTVNIATTLATLAALL